MLSGFNKIKYDALKKLSKDIGMYRVARWINRHLLNRDELEQERGDLEFYGNILPSDIHRQLLIFDVGANVGQKTRVFLKLGARVVALEPQPDCFEELNFRCGRHRNLTPVNAAVASNSGSGKFYLRAHRAASGLVEEWEGEVQKTIDVKLLTLDELIAIHGRPYYIKIDVEGFELEVLRGLSCQVPLISFEYHLRDKDIQKTLDCLNLLSEFGEISLNATPAERLLLKYPRWKSKKEFLSAFPRDFDPQSEFFYGDIWVRAGRGTCVGSPSQSNS